MLFRNFRGSGPSWVPILKILGIYMIWDTFLPRKPSLILRPREHFAPYFWVIVFDAFSRRHFSNCFRVLCALRGPEASLFETFLMTFPRPPENVKTVFSLQSQFDSGASGGSQNH